MPAYRSLLSLLIIILLTNCSAHTNLVPTGKGKLNANISVGGPIISAFESNFPVPYGTVGLSYGMYDRFDLNGNFHLLPVAYQIIGFDFGSTWYPLMNKGLSPSIGINPRLMMLTSFKSNVSDRVKVYPIISGSSAWKIGKDLLYSGFDATIPLTSLQYDNESPSSIFSLFGGYRWKVGQNTFISTELKWHAVNVQTNQLAVDYLSLGHQGALATLFSIMRDF